LRKEHKDDPIAILQFSAKRESRTKNYKANDKQAETYESEERGIGVGEEDSMAPVELQLPAKRKLRPQKSQGNSLAKKVCLVESDVEAAFVLPCD
jgi:hypothetical protein